MKEFIDYLPGLLTNTLTAVVTNLYHNWLPLSFAILIAALMKVYLDSEKLKQMLLKKPRVSILASVAFGAFTPLCACGTMAVVIGLLSTALPWGPIMAFLTSSPLMSPDTYIMIAGILDFKFANALAVASLLIGLISGGLTHIIEQKTHFLDNQLRFSMKSNVKACACSASALALEQISAENTCGCSTASFDANVISLENTEPTLNFWQRLKVKEVGQVLLEVGLKQILFYFVIFVALGYLVQSFVPTSFIITLFSSESIFSVPLAALIGLPLYVSGAGAIPLIKALMDGGAGAGAMMAFMITGPATSLWVITGITTFMKKRVIGLYIGFILVGGILMGYLYQILIAMGI